MHRNANNTHPIRIEISPPWKHEEYYSKRCYTKRILLTPSLPRPLLAKKERETTSENEKGPKQYIVWYKAKGVLINLSAGGTGWWFHLKSHDQVPVYSKSKEIPSNSCRLETGLSSHGDAHGCVPGRAVISSFIQVKWISFPWGPCEMVVSKSTNRIEKM